MNGKVPPTPTANKLVFLEVPVSAYTRKAITFAGILGRHLERLSDLYTSRKGQQTYYGTTVNVQPFQGCTYFVSKALIDHPEIAQRILEEIHTLKLTHHPAVPGQTSGRHYIQGKEISEKGNVRLCQALIERTTFADLLFLKLRRQDRPVNQAAVISLITRSSYQIQSNIESIIFHEFREILETYPELRIRLPGTTNKNKKPTKVKSGALNTATPGEKEAVVKDIPDAILSTGRKIVTNWDIGTIGAALIEAVK